MYVFCAMKRSQDSMETQRSASCQRRTKEGVSSYLLRSIAVQGYLQPNLIRSWYGLNMPQLRLWPFSGAKVNLMTQVELAKLELNT